MNCSLASRVLAFTLLAGCSRERQSPVVTPVVVMKPDPPKVVEKPPAPPTSAPEPPKPEDDCNEQTPQEFLSRAHINRPAKSREDRAEMLRLRAESIAYRTEQYGYFEGFGDRKLNPKTPAQSSISTTFFGVPIVMHERVVPALKCVEARLKRDCAEYDYKPSNLSGLRKKNTYVDGEVSNHVYGIAIDIDPLKNPCCKCLEPWSSSERCKGNKTVWQRMAMPECWVNTFERYGFYWLGHDTLEDTMHFEFLGDPSKIR